MTGQIMTPGVEPKSEPPSFLTRGVVTTTEDPRPDMETLARAIAQQADLNYLPYRTSIIRTRAEEGADFAVVVERENLKVVWDGGEFRHHPGLSIYRVGVDQPNHFLGATRPRWGEMTLDLTLGFARDAMLIADRTSQRVDGFERNPIIAMLTAYGLQRLLRIKRFRRVAPLVRVIRGDSFRALTTLGRGRYDLVLLDPMFPRPVPGSNDMEFLHHLVRPVRFDVEVLRLAAAVARRRVVLRWPRSEPLPDLGFDQIIPGPRNRYDFLTLDLSRRESRYRLRRR